MKIGDLVKVTFINDLNINGHGIYLGLGNRKEKTGVHTVFWKGRIATFDKDVWSFVIMSSIDK